MRIMGLILLALLPVFHSPAQAQAQDPPWARAMSATDPNREAGWDWTEEKGHTLYYSTRGERPTEIRDVRLPFFCAKHPLNVPERDMDPADGWMLVHRDFGTPEHAPPMPYFSLYNRYRGKFRFLVFNSMAREESYYLADLSFWGGGAGRQHAAALFTLFNSVGCFLEDYDGELKETQTSEMRAYGDWAVFDFSCVGYDPGLAGRDPVLELLLTGVETSRLKLDGRGDLKLLEEVVQQSPPGFDQNGTERAEEALKRGFRWAGEVRKWIRDEATNPRNKDEVWFPLAKALAGSAVLSYAPWVAGLAGAIDAFVGGNHKATPREPLRFQGQFTFEIEGGLERSRKLWALGLYLKPGPQDSFAQRPVQDIPWGLVGINRLPAITLGLTGDRKGLIVKLADDGGQVVNPACGMDLVSTQVAFVFRSLRDGKNYASPYLDLDTARGQGHLTTLPGIPWELRWQYVFRARTPVLHADPEIVVCKTTYWQYPRDSTLAP